MDKQALIEFIENFKILLPDELDTQEQRTARHWYNAAISNIVDELQTKLSSIRPEIMAFAEAMEKEMARHDVEKGDSWKDMTIGNFYGILIDHALYLRDAKYRNHPQDIRHESIDIANYAMMIWHKAKGE